MEKVNPSQLELFSQTKNYSKIQGPNNAFFTYIRNYEKTILIIVGFIITGIISFSLGFEKGRSLTTLKANPRFDMAAKIKPVAHKQTKTEQQYQPNNIEKQDIIEQPKIKESIQNYTIQVATYQTKTHAEKEAQVLRKKGFAPLILSKGRYTIICIGNFPNKQTAKSLLSELKKRYQDCYIRRI